MKKILLGLFTIAILFSACKEEVTPVTVVLSQTSMTAMDIASKTKTMMVTITNNTSNDAEIEWERTETTSPTGFTYMVNSAAAMSGTITVEAGASQDIMLAINPNGNIGEASGMIKFYDAADQTGTMQTFNYSLTTIANWFTITPQGLMTDSERATFTKDYYIDVYNPNTDTVYVTWEKVDNLVTGWETAICTDLVCWTPAIYTKEMPVAPQSTVVFKATFDAMSNVGNGTLDALFYMADDSMNTVVSQTIDHTATQ